jgi:hypothetical protein
VSKLRTDDFIKQWKVQNNIWEWNETRIRAIMWDFYLASQTEEPASTEEVEVKYNVEVIKLGVYKHYKGNYYLVLGLGRHSETEEVFVIYVPLYYNLQPGPRITLRPLSNFLTKTKEGNSRFEYVGSGI